MDETTAACDLILPDHHPLEQWGDSRPRAGVVGLQQPVVQPVFGTQPTGDVILKLSGKSGRSSIICRPSGAVATRRVRPVLDGCAGQGRDLQRRSDTRGAAGNHGGQLQHHVRRGAVVGRRRRSNGGRVPAPRAPRRARRQQAVAPRAPGSGVEDRLAQLGRSASDTAAKWVSPPATSCSSSRISAGRSSRRKRILTLYFNFDLI